MMMCNSSTLDVQTSLLTDQDQGCYTNPISGPLEKRGCYDGKNHHFGYSLTDG